MSYSDKIPKYGDVFTVEEFREACAGHSFIDDDGHGNPAKDGKMDSKIHIRPSRVSDIPGDATHIVWYNK